MMQSGLMSGEQKPEKFFFFYGKTKRQGDLVVLRGPKGCRKPEYLGYYAFGAGAAHGLNVDMIQRYIQMGVPAKGPSRQVLEELGMVSSEDEDPESGGRECNGTMSHSQDQPGLQEALEMLSFLQRLGFGEADLTSKDEINRLYGKLDELQEKMYGRPLNQEELEHEIAASDQEIAELEAKIKALQQKLKQAKTEEARHKP